MKTDIEFFITQMEKLNTEKVIERFRSKHGDLYDYSMFEYCGMHNKSKIICKIHGVFEQEPHSHLKGQGCPICGKLRRIEKRFDNRETFIEKARNKHGDKYNYDKVVYKSSYDYVCITCPKHGDFMQTPNTHLNGRGCPKCYEERRSEVNRKDFSVFLNEMKELYGDRYDFNNYDYVNNRKRSALICNRHGIFYRNPNDLLNGKHCPKCMKEERKERSMIKNGNSFIEKAIEVHGDRYSYDKVKYVDCFTPVEITCKKHGSFFQRPTYHLCGNGCQKCANEIISSMAESEICEYLESCNISFITNDRKKLKGNELDILIYLS